MVQQIIYDQYTVQSNSIQLEKLFKQCTATVAVQSNNILVDKWFNQTICSSKLENNTKKFIKYHQTIQTHDSQPQSQSTFECSTQMTLTNDIFASVTELNGKMRWESGCAVHIIYHKGTQNMLSYISQICCLTREYIDKELSKHS